MKIVTVDVDISQITALAGDDYQAFATGESCAVNADCTSGACDAGICTVDKTILTFGRGEAFKFMSINYFKRRPD